MMPAAAVAPAPLPPAPPAAAPRRSARRRRAVVSLATLAVLVVVPNLLYRVGLDHGPVFLRDPDYAVRIDALRARMAEHPARPPVVVLGSSRAGMGIRPDASEPADATAPLVFNFSASGGGPVAQAMTVRRLHANGVAPAAVVLEFWPPLLRGDGVYHEQGWIAPHRLRAVDEPSVRQFFRDPDATWAARYGDSPLPLHGLRQPLLNQVWPGVLPAAQRTDRSWRTTDGWGWWPAWEHLSPPEAEFAWKLTEVGYRARYEGFRIEPQHAAAFRTAVAECRGRNVPVLVARLPESERFRGLQTPEVERLADDYLTGVSAEFGLEVLDCRRWDVGDELPDGIHLTQPGAAAFSRRFVGEVREWWGRQRRAER